MTSVRSDVRPLFFSFPCKTAEQISVTSTKTADMNFICYVYI